MDSVDARYGLIRMNDIRDDSSLRRIFGIKYPSLFFYKMNDKTNKTAYYIIVRAPKQGWRLCNATERDTPGICRDLETGAGREELAGPLLSLI